jgi:hypothetical protein
MSDETFWLDEGVTPMVYDPLYALMLERGEIEDIEDIIDVRLGVRDQAQLQRFVAQAYCAEEQESECDAESVQRTLQRRMARTVKLLTVRIERHETSFEAAMQYLIKLGVERDEAIELLTH